MADLGLYVLWISSKHTSGVEDNKRLGLCRKRKTHS